MSFVGSINTDVRAVLAEMAPAWRGRAVYVGCSGNLTVERLLHQAGVQEIHGNDVSMYSCVLGSFAAGANIEVGVQDSELSWLEEWLTPGLDTIATLLLCSEALKSHGRPEPYHRRIWKAYMVRWEDLHRRTVDKLADLLKDLRLTSFSPLDVNKYLRQVPWGSVVVGFPPTYTGGYETLYKKLDATFSWDEPSYDVFDDKSFLLLVDLMREKQTWVTLRDHPVEELEDCKVAVVQTAPRSKPVYIYGQSDQKRITVPRQKLEGVPLERLGDQVGDQVGDDLQLCALTAGQFNTLRSQSLNPEIVPAPPGLAMGVLCDGLLLGAFGLSFDGTKIGMAPWDAYLMSDFPITQTTFPRLSKLVLAAVLSVEVKAVMEQQWTRRIRTIGTTAFTKRPVSMKYRGLFSLHSRKEGMLNYMGQTGKWTLQEALAWWKKKHGRRSVPSTPT